MKYRNFLLAFALFTAPNGSAALYQADSLAFLERQVDQLDARDIVVFDMDDVLIVPQDALVQNQDEDIAKYGIQMNKEERVHFASLIWKQAKTSLVESHIPSLIQALQQRGVKVIVLTAAPIGRLGVIEDTMTFRIGELREKGIHLRHAFPEIDLLVLESLNQGKSSPVFSQGVLLSNRFPKGTVLAAFLTHIDWKPRRLIFIDDLRHNLDSMEAEMAKLNLEEVQCWHYTAADKHAKEVSREIALIQIRTLIECGVWLSDEEAKKLLP